MELLVLFTALIFIFTFTIEAALVRTNTSLPSAVTNGTNNAGPEPFSPGVYDILRAEIYQRTVNISTNSSVLTIREDFCVIVQGVTAGSLPVRCNSSWLTTFVGFPANMPLICVDPTVNVTLLQGEVWPEYGGFFIFVQLQ